MAKTYHVVRPPDCSAVSIQSALDDITTIGGTVISVITHGAPTLQAGGKVGVDHDSRWCIVDIFYSKGA